MPDDNVYDLFGSSNDDGSDNTEDLNTFDESGEADPSVVAFMDQQSAEFNAKAEHEFAARYGFVHKCRCDQDYSSGNLVEVTECYAGMTLEALDTCARLNTENQMLQKVIAAIAGGQLAEFGLEEPSVDVHATDADGLADDEGSNDDTDPRGDTFA